MWYPMIHVYLETSSLVLNHACFLVFREGGGGGGGGDYGAGLSRRWTLYQAIIPFIARLLFSIFTAPNAM